MHNGFTSTRAGLLESKTTGSPASTHTPPNKNMNSSTCSCFCTWPLAFTPLLFLLHLVSNSCDLMLVHLLLYLFRLCPEKQLARLLSRNSRGRELFLSPQEHCTITLPSSPFSTVTPGAYYQDPAVLTAKPAGVRVPERLLISTDRSEKQLKIRSVRMPEDTLSHPELAHCTFYASYMIPPLPGPSSRTVSLCMKDAGVSECALLSPSSHSCHLVAFVVQVLPVISTTT